MQTFRLDAPSYCKHKAAIIGQIFQILFLQLMYISCNNILFSHIES